MQLQDELKKYRLNEDEYGQISRLLGRPPQGIEWPLFSALWSEHCSYKSSKIHLRKLFNQTERVQESFGENAGIVDLGHGERVAFKMESHNHPSFIEPFQGAATGVGGILRDIFTMGARPIALANYLCFGRPQADRMEALVDGVVQGISGYGNCVGVPNISGQTEFHESYDQNILVNAFALGYFGPGDPVCLSEAKGPGNFVVYVGAKTGRDGIHGASMASESFSDGDESKRPTVQIGDPFFEKLLIESCIEVMKQGLVESIQDMGAAGLTSSSFEMSAKGGVGLDLHLDQVPLRDSSMTPEDILLSESQERMLLVCRPENVENLKAAFDRWNLDATVIGSVRKEREIRIFWRNEVLCEMDPAVIVDEAPEYDRPHSPWKSPRIQPQWQPTQPAIAGGEALLNNLNSIQGCSRQWIYQQYDQRVGAKTVVDCSGSVGVLRLPSGRGLAVVLGGRPHIMRLDAEIGGMDSLAYPSLELLAKGFEPVGATDCLNYGNPEKTEIMSEFVASLEGMNRVAEKLHVPIISGNVSFYNESDGKNITSTPATAVVGLRQSIENIPANEFLVSNQPVYLLSSGQVELDHGGNGTGAVDLSRLKQFSAQVLLAANSPGVMATRIVGKFGLSYALARMSQGGVGVNISSEELADHPTLGHLFSEKLYQLLVVVKEDGAKELESRVGSNLQYLGTTGGDRLVIGDHINIALADIVLALDSGWEKHFATLA